MVKKIVKIFIFLILLITFSTIIYTFIIVNNVKLDKSKLSNGYNSMQLYDKYNQKILSMSDMSFTPICEVPKHLINAFVSIEDKEFFNHNGINPKRILSALYKNITTLSLREGASTITQQLIKNTQLSPQKTFDRKIKEIKLAIDLENEYSKDKIMENYLNILYMGSNIYGIGEASYKYFGKNVKDLTLSECATIAGVVKSPQNYSPLINLDNAIKRRNLVLSEMREDGYINESEYQSAQNSPLTLSNSKDCAISYKQSIINECMQLLRVDEKTLSNMGLKIYTNYDEYKQKLLYLSIKNNLPTTLSGKKADYMGILCNNDGSISAYVSNSAMNIQDIRRQPGSTIKPFVSYLPAIKENLISIDTPINDCKITINEYSPSNYQDKYLGWIPASTALATSSNSVAVSLANQVGIYACVDYASRFGIRFDSDDYVLSTALGGMTKGVTMTEMIGAYNTLINNGYYIKPTFVRIIEDKNGNILYKNSNVYRQVESPENCYILSEMLHNTTLNGTAKALQSIPNLYSKTGTVSAYNSQNNSDVWNITYNSNMVSCIWYGNLSNTINENLPKQITGGGAPTLATKNLYQNIQKQSGMFNKIQTPQNVIECKIDEYDYKYHNTVSLDPFFGKKFVCTKSYYDELLRKYKEQILND